MRFIYYPTYCRLDGIVLGVAIAAVKWRQPQIWRRLMEHPAYLLCASGAFLLASVLALWVHYSFWCSTLGFTLLDVSFALLTLAALSHSGPLSKYRLPGAQSLAVLSYSIYLTHSLALEVNELFLKQAEIQMYMVVAVFSVVASVVVFAFSFARCLFIHIVFMTWKDRLVGETSVPYGVGTLEHARETVA
jgi:peptidoglycan/LPS O-acetylase OafA/YrhL